MKSSICGMKTQLFSRLMSSQGKMISKVESIIDSLEQFTLRNSVRISGIPEELNENTDDIILKLVDKLDVSMISADIDRSHRVGKPNNRGRTAATTRTRSHIQC